jgi:hypothetical protein
MKIDLNSSEEFQTLTQYNNDLELGDAEIECGDFITADDLKIEANNWT